MKETKLPCPVETTLGVVGGKWKTIILYHLDDGVRRFGELRRTIPGITQKVLTQQLRELEADGIISRKIYPTVPPKVEYALTNYGKTLRPVLQAMGDWGTMHAQRRAANGRAAA
jgi:DNA-binding HxlR family transcriptional regulator